MPDLPTLASMSILASLILYALLGGADFGGGVLNLYRREPRAAARRLLVARAIGPVWETNHIWVIIAVVVLFTAFPRAYAVISTSLFLPITLMLAGIVLRGAAFAFHHYHPHGEEGQDRWERIFAGASLLTPLLLGAIVGAVASGDIGARDAATGISWAWLAPFPLAVGLLALAVFSFLAAVYLILETDELPLQEDFRSTALWSSWGVAVLLLVVLLLARRGATEFFHSLLGRGWSVGIVFLAASAALGAHVSLLRRAYGLARVCAAAQAALILAGWGGAQYPFLVRPGLSIPATAAPAATLRLILIALAAGAFFLFPAIFLLFRVFKREALFGRPRSPSPGE
ncbi:MAG: cytochrome d ubiquinol oxidase subunit II [Deltaproteobacteria bacterium]|nr:cytochrome d ubiquinol oxidase subunit II [Deltaproteobacteria bacterium]PWB66763.1 MAG: cytochrome BD ubiquinol oxidase subunit II [Deltaproteobacteria bacterium]